MVTEPTTIGLVFACGAKWSIRAALLADCLEIKTNNTFIKHALATEAAKARA